MLIFPDLYIDIHITYAMRMRNGIAYKFIMIDEWMCRLVDSSSISIVTVPSRTFIVTITLLSQTLGLFKKIGFSI